MKFPERVCNFRTVPVTGILLALIIISAGIAGCVSGVPPRQPGQQKTPQPAPAGTVPPVSPTAAIGFTPTPPKMWRVGDLSQSVVARGDALVVTGIVRAQTQKIFMYYYDFRNNSYYGGVEEVPLAPNGSYKKTFSTHMFNEGNYAVILKLPTGETVVQLRFTVEEPYIEINPFRISSNVVPLSGTTNCAAGDMLEVAVLCYSPEVQGWVRTGESQYVPVMKGTTNINRWSASFDAATLVPGVYIVKVSSASPAAAAKALFTITGQ